MDPIKKSEIFKIVITGTNRGLGKAIVEKFLLSDNIQQNLLICTARNIESGEKAIKELQTKFPGFSNNLIFHQLDVTDPKSISNFKSFLIEEHQNFDILINNAGVGFYETGDEENILEIVQKTLEVNLTSQINLTENLLDIMREGGHIINISSSMGQLKFKNSEIKNQFLNLDQMTQEKFEEMQRNFLEASKNHAWEKDGWLNGAKLNNGYGVSKAFLNLYTRMLDRRLKSQSINIKVNTCSPGHCQTDMGGPNAPKTALEGSDTPVWLAFFTRERDDSLSGNYYRDRINSPYYLI